DERRRYLIKRLENIGMPAFEPLGAFYIFPSIQKFGMSSDEFATKLLQEQKLAVVPGNAFGNSGEGFIRISYAYSIDQLREALDRIEAFVSK
ncbi:MAG: aminotransferase class I/II-fold pyridoxal phosphate-dependent enzyme, partial [Lachnospiraceae bacterium]|nr:aminotransferase class I/II-fold pyridoxal phosphate-dependent enzyme [Lachnospiraceae bacterium]